ncbi:hypothetical protein BH24ACT6_BH24ACT6_17880 [soil metagenome]
MPRRQDDVDTGAYGSHCRCAGWLAVGRNDEDAAVEQPPSTVAKTRVKGLWHAHVGWDPSARLIRIFERLAWADGARWPSSDDIGRRTNTLAGADVGYQGDST